MRLIQAILTVIATTMISPAFGNEMIRPRSIEGVLEREHAYSQPYYRLPDSKVAWANYAAIRRDFEKLKGLSNEQIDSWILVNFARISKLQLDLRNIRVNNFNYDSKDPSTFAHPSGYGRSAVASAFNINPDGTLDRSAEIGVVDTKGGGHGGANSVATQVNKWPRLTAVDREAVLVADHSDGMMSLGEGIAEVSRQTAVQSLFDLYNSEHGTGFQTIESYFLIAIPIKILKNQGKFDWAGIYGRQAHIRGASHVAVPDGTYVDEYGGRQTSILDSSVDYGGVIITDPDLQKTFGSVEALRAISKDHLDPQLSNAWNYGHATANAFVEAAGTNYAHARYIIDHHLSEMLSPLSERLKHMKPQPNEFVNYVRPRLHARDSYGISLVHARLMQLNPDDLLKLVPDIVKDLNIAEIQRALQSPHFRDPSPSARMFRKRVEKAIRESDNPDAAKALSLGLSTSGVSDKTSKIVELFLKQPLSVYQAIAASPVDELVPYLPKVFKEPTAISVYLNTILAHPDFKAKFPTWHRYIVQQSIKNYRYLSDRTVEFLLPDLAAKDPEGLFRELERRFTASGADRYSQEVHLKMMKDFVPRQMLLNFSSVIHEADEVGADAFLDACLTRPELAREPALQNIVYTALARIMINRQRFNRAATVAQVLASPAGAEALHQQMAQGHGIIPHSLLPAMRVVADSGRTGANAARRILLEFNSIDMSFEAIERWMKEVPDAAPQLADKLGRMKLTDEQLDQTFSGKWSDEVIGRFTKSFAAKHSSDDELMMRLLSLWAESPYWRRPIVAEFISATRSVPAVPEITSIDRLLHGSPDVVAAVKAVLQPANLTKSIALIEPNTRSKISSMPRLEFFVGKLYKKDLKDKSFTDWDSANTKDLRVWSGFLITLKLYGDAEGSAKADTLIAKQLKSAKGRELFDSMLNESHLPTEDVNRMRAALDANMGFIARQLYKVRAIPQARVCSRAYGV